MRWVGSDGFRRIQKRRARKYYEQGGEIYLCPYKLRPGEPWHPEAVAHMDGLEGRDASAAFDFMVDMFEFYNCNHQSGEYAAFYVKDVGDVQR